MGEIGEIHSEREIQAHWNDIRDGKYGNDPEVIKPEILIDDGIEQVISIPNADGTDRKSYRRKSGGIWELAH